MDWAASGWVSMQTAAPMFPLTRILDPHPINLIIHGVFTLSFVFHTDSVFMECIFMNQMRYDIIHGLV